MTAQGPRPLSEFGKRRVVLLASAWRVCSWYGKRLEVDLFCLKSVFMFSMKDSMRSSSCGGMSCCGGFQVDLTYSFGGCWRKSVLSSPAKIVFRCRSRRSRERVAVMLFWVNFGV